MDAHILSDRREAEALSRYRSMALLQMNEYFSYCNQNLGWGFALACAGLDLPTFFAWATLIFLLFAWYIGSAGYRQHLSALKAIGEPGVRLRKMVLEMRTAFTGWLALSLVAVGLVDKHGLTHLGVVFHACHG
jgi:hypothetical protein